MVTERREQKPDHTGSDAEVVDALIPRRGQITKFDLLRWRRGEAYGVPSRSRRVPWRWAAPAGLFLGILTAWPDIVGGARGDIIATKFILASGVSFFFLSHLKQTAFWTAGISGAGLVFALATQVTQFLRTDRWDSWRVGDFVAVELVTESERIGLSGWFLDRDLLVVLLVVAVVMAALGAISHRLRSP